MEWIICFIISIICLVSFVLGAIVRGKAIYKRGRFLTPLRLLFIGVSLSSVSLFIPICINTFRTNECGPFETILIAIYNMIKLFIADSDFEFITANLADVSTWIFKSYTILFSVLFVLAPLLTFGFVLSFFKNVSAYKRYITHYNKNVFVFSELNEKSLALAKSLHKNNPKKRFFVFTDVFEKEEERSYELVEKAKEIGAVCFKKDISGICFSFHSKKSDLNFFAINEEQSQNINQALKIIDAYKYRKNTNLYVFSTQVEAEVLLGNAFGAKFDKNKDEDEKQQQKQWEIKVRRVNEVQSLINRILYEDGFEKIFSSAWQDEKGIKRIHALVLGMGQHGMEMTKALTWFCQMDGYQVEINSFDMDDTTEDKFASLCPELMDFSGKLDIVGEAKYTISIHSGVDVGTKTFDDIVTTLPRTTYVFVALGNDERNISTAVKLRSIYARLGYHPQIQAVVCNTEKKEALTGIVNFKGQPYDIDFIGDIQSSYSEEVILDSDVEDEALKRHLKWGEESEFWQYDYNYKSSIASAIHRKMKILCQMPGIEKEPSERTETELELLRRVEHCRWNAYMRSEGYVYGGTMGKEGRNDLAKMHNLLVPYDELDKKEQEKDDD